MAKQNFRFIDDGLREKHVFKRFLGKGTFGAVFKVQGLLDNRPYAMKVISNVTEELYNRVRYEIALMQEMEHPQIVKYHDSFLDRGKQTLVILMELCDVSLSDVIHDLEEASRSSTSGRSASASIFCTSTARSCTAI